MIQGAVNTMDIPMNQCVKDETNESMRINRIYVSGAFGPCAFRFVGLETVGISPTRLRSTATSLEQ